MVSFDVPSFLETTLDVPVDVEELSDVPLFLEITLEFPFEFDVLSDVPLFVVVPTTDVVPLWLLLDSVIFSRSLYCVISQSKEEVDGSIRRSCL